MTINDINQAIIAGNFSNDQLNGIAMSIKFARNQLTQQNRRSITVGTQVRFTNSRTGRYEIGTVKEIKIKNVIINTGSSTWRVPANMLEVV
jgi:pyruvate/2-oxoglutarate dehydrogenase complex dihydrolipoamide dehydrogenase (E3) component